MIDVKIARAPGDPLKSRVIVTQNLLGVSEELAQVISTHLNLEAFCTEEFFNEFMLAYEKVSQKNKIEDIMQTGGHIIDATIGSYKALPNTLDKSPTLGSDVNGL